MFDIEITDYITCKSSNSPLDVVSVVALYATDTITKQEWWPSNEDDSGEGKNSEDTIPNCTSLLQEDPGQEWGKDWITEERMDNGRKDFVEQKADTDTDKTCENIRNVWLWLNNIEGSCGRSGEKCWALCLQIYCKAEVYGGIRMWKMLESNEGEKRWEWG